MAHCLWSWRHRARYLPRTLQTYFAQIQPIDASKAEDGVFVGNILVDVAEAAKKADRASAIRTFVMRTAALRESEFAALDDMLIGTLATQSFSVRAKDVPQTDPAALTSAEAWMTGRGLECIVRLSATHVEAVDDLLVKYPALAVMAQQHAWFRPMVETIAKRRLASAPFGLKLRLGIGAGLSTADMLSDIYSIVGMLQAGPAFGAYGMIAMIGACLALQLLLCILQNKHRGRDTLVKELCIVLSLAKPGVDAVRVASGSEQVAGAPLDAAIEMVSGKCIEIATESGPGAALQATVVLSGYWSTAAVVSVAISCLTTGFTTAMMSFDLDTSPAKRKSIGEFYGYIPDTSRGRFLVFVELFTLHSAHAMVKTLTVACLARTNWRWLVGYIAADHWVYILYKVARSDLVWWMPGVRFICLRWMWYVLCLLHVARSMRRPWASAVLAASGCREDRPRLHRLRAISQCMPCGRLLLLLQRCDDARCVLWCCCAVLRVRHWHRS